MSKEKKRALKVFLCHASGDKPSVRDLYKRLTMEGVDAWLDKEKLLPGQDWRLEIPRAVQDADVVVVCLSKKSITKEGYVQKEIKFALDIAEEKPEGTIFLIPARLEDCVVPERLNRWQWVDLSDDDGFIKLLRSLKLRADAVGATVEPTSYADSDEETERKLEQLYTEGLAAFYTEDWDKACYRFQTILSERPTHKQATEKLEEAKKRSDLAKLYERATAAVHLSDWGTAIQILEELSQRSVDYKDVAQLLKNAQKQKQLNELYSEAKALHAAQKWEALVRVFEQISSIDPAYPDKDNLLPSAQREVTELKRIAELNDQYGQALREMDAGNWHEARRLLETVHKAQMGFLETEKLLRKVEDEITKEDGKRRQNDQINTLYEQAHGLLRSKKWRNALEKMGQIQRLDEHFFDIDGIAEKAQKELAFEEQETERQNTLAALYAEAVKLLKAEKYQEALDQWEKVKAIDPKYPDRQRVQRVAKAAIAKQVKPTTEKPKLVIRKPIWIGLGSVGILIMLIFGANLFGKKDDDTVLVPTKFPTQVLATNTSIPLAGSAPSKTATPRPATATPIISAYSDPTMLDDFDQIAYDGSYNNSLWINPTTVGFVISQSDGKLAMKVFDSAAGSGFNSIDIMLPNVPIFMEAKVFLDPTTIDNESYITASVRIGYSVTYCSIFGVGSSRQWFECNLELFEKPVNSKVTIQEISLSWHVIRIEYDPETATFSYWLDGLSVGSIAIPTALVPTQNGKLFLSIVRLGINNYGPSTSPIGYVDYVRLGAISNDPNSK